MKVVWGFVAVLGLGLAAFIQYLTYTNPDLPIGKGLAITAVPLAVTVYGVIKMRAAAAPKSDAAPEPEEA